MSTILRKTVAVALCAAMIVMGLVMLPESRAEAATKTMKMPTRMTLYTMQNNKWVKVASKTYKYNKKGDLVRFSDSRSDGPVKIKYKYKGKRKVSATAKSKYTRKNIKFNKKGQLTYVKGRDLAEKTVYTDTFRYNKRGYLTSLKWTDSNKEYTYHKGTYTYSTDFGEEGNVTITMIGRDFYGDTQASMVTLNKTGLITDANYSGDLFSYEYTMSGSYVKRRIETIEYTDGSIGMYRTDYQYGKTRAPAATYYMYINDDDRALATNL